MEVLTDNKSQAQVAETYGVHPNTVGSWKKILWKKGAEVFAKDSVVSEYERRIADLKTSLDEEER